MDEARAERLGIEPIAGTLAAIDRIETKAGLVRMLAELERIGDQRRGGLLDRSRRQAVRSVHPSSFPGRPRTAGPRLLLGRQVQGEAGGLRGRTSRGAWRLCGVGEAPGAAAEIVAFETRLAKAQWSKVANRDNIKTYNKRSRAELVRLAPGFDWNVVLRCRRRRRAEELIVAQPSYFTAIAAMADAAPLGIWKAWLKWKVVQAHAEPAEPGDGR